jgi:hypothetical protein
MVKPMQNGIALYKGPATNWWYRLLDTLVKLWTRSKYSHIEVVINGICYSSSSRDDGVRGKVINIYSGRWDLYPIHIEPTTWLWFKEHSGDDYDWLGVARFVFPFIPHRSKKWFCFEAAAAALQREKPHKWAGREFEQWLSQMDRYPE